MQQYASTDAVVQQGAMLDISFHQYLVMLPPDCLLLDRLVKHHAM
jgi:hypothetical protein